MKVTGYHKLVRDRIPEIIEKSGKKCVVRVMAQDEYMQMADQKLNEELAEYQQSKSLEELADLLEVIYAAAKAHGFSAEDIEKMRRDKAAQRGGFDKRLLLIEVREDDG